MSALPQGLKAFARALRTDADERLTLDGRPVRRLTGWPGEQAWSPLGQTLLSCVYERLYCLPYPQVPDDIASEEDLTEKLEAANATPARIEPGWTVREVLPGPLILAERHGRMRRFAADELVDPAQAAAIRPGQLFAPHLAGGSRRRQPGFYYCFGLGFRDANDLCPLVRLYFNVTIEGAASLVVLLTRALNRYELPFDLKVTTRGKDFARSDNAVLYLARDSFRAAMLALTPCLPALRPLLAPAVPLFAKTLAPGIGLAEDPGGGESFGTSRSKLVAAALLAARKGDGFAWGAFDAEFRAAVAAGGLRIDALWLNPGSPHLYALPVALPAQVEAR